MIYFKNVSVSFKHKHSAVSDINLKLNAGDFTLLLGPTGSGKSTLLRLIYMDIFPSEGNVTVRNWNSGNISVRQINHLRREVGVVFQDFKLIENMNVFDNIALPLVIEGRKKKYIQRIVSLLMEKFALSHTQHQPASTLSLGEKQRVAIARAMVKNPFILIADEPTGNLDREASKNVLNLLEQINRSGTSVVMATHDYALIKDTPYRRLYMENGQLLPPSNTIDLPNKRITILAKPE